MNFRKPIRLTIFDVAGTIIEDHGEVLSCFATALKKNNIQASEAELQEWKGASKREVIKHFVGAKTATAEAEDLVSRTYNDFRHLLEKRYHTGGVVPIPGVESTFRWLLQRGVSIACTTGFYLGELASKAQVQSLLFYHYDPENKAEQQARVAAVKKYFHGPVLAPMDLDRFCLSKDEAQSEKAKFESCGETIRSPE